MSLVETYRFRFCEPGLITLSVTVYTSNGQCPCCEICAIVKRYSWHSRIAQVIQVVNTGHNNLYIGGMAGSFVDLPGQLVRVVCSVVCHLGGI